MTIPPIFPTTNPGWSFVKRAKTGSTRVATAGTGRRTRARLWVYPLWEWDLTYEYLPDDFSPGAATLSDFRTQLGNFLNVAGMFGGFLFLDPDEHTILGQFIATGDGSTTTYTLVKSFGLAPANTATEPVGYLAIGGDFTFAAYVNGALLIDGEYTLNTLTPCQQQITFTVAPPKGSVITVDMSYFYYVHFKEDVAELENFAQTLSGGATLWSLKKFTLESLRG